MEQDDEERNKFLKNLGEPIVNVNEFLKEHGINWVENKKCSKSNDVENLQEIKINRPGTSSVDDLFEHKLEEYERTLFASELTDSVDSDDILNNLAKAVEQLCKNDNRPKVKTFVNETSLFNPIYNVDSTNKPDLGSSEIENKDVNTKPPGYTDVKKFLQTFKHFHSNITASQLEGNDVTDGTLTAQELANVFASLTDNLKHSGSTSSTCIGKSEINREGIKSIKLETSKEQNSLNEERIWDSSGSSAKSATDSNITDKKTESPIKVVLSDSKKSESSSPTSPKTTKKKKRKKENEYEPKKVPITWCNPKEDLSFAKELESIMDCDLFPLNKNKLPVEPEVDDFIGKFIPPQLPRNMVEMLTSASENTYTDWEYSIMAEKDELSDCEYESDLEELLVKVKDECLSIKEDKNIPLNNARIPKFNKEYDATAKLNNQEFMLCFMPPNVEELVSVRSDNLKIIGYTTKERSEEVLGREFERVYADRESDESEEDTEEEEEEEKEEKKETEPLFNFGTATEEELSESLQKLKEFTETLDISKIEQFDPKLKEEREKVDKFLDHIGVPKAGHIGAKSVDQHWMDEANNYSHIVQLSKDELCPPGILEVDVTTDDKNDKYFEELGKNSKMDQFKTIKRPAQLAVNFPHELEGDGNEASGSEVSNKTSEESQPLLCSKENMKKIETEESDIEEIHNVFEDESSSDSESPNEHEDSDLDDEDNAEDIALDKQFKEEYFRKGGTEEGLGNYEEDEVDLVDKLQLESLESYSEKFFTFPFVSKQMENLNFVRIRRLIAQNFPDLRPEALVDLSQDIAFPISSPSDSSDNEEIHFKADPLDVFKEAEEGVEGNQTADFTPYNEIDLSFAEEIDDVDLEVYVQSMVPSDRSQKDLAGEIMTKRLKKKTKKKSDCKKESNEESSDSEDSNRNRHKVTEVVWDPRIGSAQPTHSAVIENMEKLHPLIVSTPPKFKIPKHMKAWLLGEYTPSKETLQKWKKLVVDFYGNQTMLDKIINSDKYEEYELFLETVEENLDFDEDESNTLLKFKFLLQEKKQSNLVESFYKEDTAPRENNGREVTQGGDELKEEDANLVKNENQLKPEVQTKTTEIPQKDDDVKDGAAENEAPQLPIIYRVCDIKFVTKQEEWAEKVNCNKCEETISNPAMTFSFNLDGFQRQAIKALENGNNVFVAAHTSAGKTVVAEYAIAMSKRNRTKAVYTSPVKALSNQKYADFKRIFGSVGLITGDIQLNENAECLVMTTEILRSMLYNNSEKIRDLEYVVFDEVHYINDPERGHVWEEVLILLPAQVKIVMLSATVPNTMEFANWVGRTKQRKVIVCATHHRPVPLNHYLYTGTGGPSPGNTYLLKSGDGTFLLDSYLQARNVMKDIKLREQINKKKQMIKRMEEEREWKSKGCVGKPPVPMEDTGAFFHKQDQTMWIALINFLKKKDWLPAVSFVFSRKKCDSFAEMLNTVDLTTKSEKSFIHRFIKSQVEKLDEVDQDLPQIQIMKGQLDKGIGVHHSGILPVMKEIVEVLFQEGKVKLLFATETFAMGVNMPARTVIFHTIKKFDGNESRLLLPAEYVQMAGRAGRRGKDSAGNVIILAKPTDVVPQHSLETLLFGNPCKLISKFRLSYRMILNTLTVSGMLTVQNMLQRSFCENHGQMEKKSLQTDLSNAEEAEESFKQSMSGVVSDIELENIVKFYNNAQQYMEEWNEVRVPMLVLSHLVRELCPGRLIKISKGPLINRTAVIIESEVFPDNPLQNCYKVLVLDQTNEYERSIGPCNIDGHLMSTEELEKWHFMVSLMCVHPSESEIIIGPNDYSTLTVKCHNVVAICKEMLKIPRNNLQEFLSYLRTKPQGFSSKNTNCNAGDTIAKLLCSQIGKCRIINEKAALSDNFEVAIRATTMWSILDEISETNMTSCSSAVMKAFSKVFCWKQALSKVEDLRHKLSDENMSLYPDFCNKMKLLKEKGYINKSENVLMKGYMAARIGKYELIVCELLMENVLVDLPPEEVAALLSFLVYQSSTDCDPLENTIPPSLFAAIKRCKLIIANLSKLERNYGIRDYEGSETSKLGFKLVPVMYAWAKQQPLKDVMEMPVDFQFQEGMLVRWIQQLLETLKEVESAARLMGDPGVPAKLQAAGQSIKRGIVFAPSLYTTME